MRSQSGVAVRLLAGLSIMAALAVSASLIGHFAVAGYKAPFRQTVDVDLPNLIATSRLAEGAVSLTANAPALVLAKSQLARQEAMARIESQVEGMKSQVGRVHDSDVAADTALYVVKQCAVLFDNLQALNKRIEERIDLDLTIEQAMADLRALDQELFRFPVPEGADAGPVRDWQTTEGRTLALLAMAANALQPVGLETARREIASGIAQATRRLERLPAKIAGLGKPLTQRLEHLALSDGGLLSLKAHRFTAGDQIRALMSRNQVLSDEMIAMVARITSNIQGNALSRSAGVIRDSERHSLLLMVIAIICVAGAAVIIIYIDRHVIRRLRELVAIMLNAVKGKRTLVIPTQSDDEIGDLGRAFQFFVATIESREAALRASERRLADIIELLPDATMVIDTEGTVLFWNKAMEHMTGVPATDMVGKGDYEYALPFYGTRRPILCDIALKEDAFIPGAYTLFESRGDALWAEAFMESVNGKPVWIRGSASLLRDSEGTVVGVIETVFDISEQRKLINDLRAAKDEAERASQAKSIFLATMSHELRTPLNSIIGFADFVATEMFGPVGDPQYAEHAGYARQSAQHLLDIINGILDLSKIEAGMVQLELVRVPVASTVTRCVRTVQDLALSAGVTIKAAVPHNIPDLWADERAIRRILINLLGNAIKFNAEDGSILVTVLEAGAFIEIVVADTGAGIPADDLERIVKPFEQIDNQYTRSQGGTGLGLSIVEGLATLHGGSLTIASAVGKGTAVTVRLPSAGQPDGPVPQCRPEQEARLPKS